MFSTHGTPRRLETDSGPPFNSEAFAVFAKEQGFKHHRVTLAHAQANGEVERFMAVLNKTEHIAKLEGKDYKSCIYDTLTAYRATPHPAHGKTPYQLMMKRDIRAKLDHYIEAVPLGYCPLGYCPPWGFVPVGFCPPGLLSPWAFVSLGYCPPGLLSPWDFVALGFCPPWILSAWILSYGFLSSGILS